MNDLILLQLKGQELKLASSTLTLIWVTLSVASSLVYPSISSLAAHTASDEKLGADY